MVKFVKMTAIIVVVEHVQSYCCVKFLTIGFAVFHLRSSDGNEACTPCPEGSVADRFGSTQCWCIRKDYSKHGVDHIRTNLLTNATLVSFGCHSCSQLPSPSRNLTVNISKSGECDYFPLKHFIELLLTVVLLEKAGFRSATQLMCKRLGQD